MGGGGGSGLQKCTFQYARFCIVFTLEFLNGEYVYVGAILDLG